MIFPSKHDNPDKTVVSVAIHVIKYLRRYQIVTYDSLLTYCCKRVEHAEYLFTPAVGLLHLLGLVEYLAKSDSFQWTGNS